MADRYRNVGGPHSREDGVIGQGDVFEPTDEEKRKIGGKLEPVSEVARASGADIGLRSLPMTDAALELALEAGLDESDFAGVEPEGADGDYLVSQVRDLIEEE